jgi:hypothetical protein
MPKSRIQKFVKHHQLGEVSEYSLTTPGQSQYLRSSRAVQDTAKLQAKINEMRARST